eukprot:Hpha_TRINITY_DN13993_c0_g2::TRINITY_DN13993_c0_g2_i1::g.35644::m.35644
MPGRAVVVGLLLLIQHGVLALPNNLNEREWREVVPQPVDPALRLFDHCSTVYGNRVYVFGGRPESGEDSDTMVVYDLASQDISTVPRSDVAPKNRYKCKMATDPASGLLYLFGGKSKWPKTSFTDFWEFSTVSQTWRELSSGTPTSPVYDSLDGYMAVINGQVVLAGADDGLHGNTFRYSIAEQRWLSVVEDGLTALNKPLLVGAGSKGYLIGGYGPTGEVSRALLSIDLRDPTPIWRQEPNSGALPLNDALKGGVLSDERRIVVFSSTGSVHLLDTHSGVWEELSVSCGALGPREDYVGEIVDDLLVVIGGATESTQYLGDAHVFSVGKRGSPEECSTSSWMPSRGNTWELLVPIQTDPQSACLAVHGTTVYAAGAGGFLEVSLTDRTYKVSRPSFGYGDCLLTTSDARASVLLYDTVSAQLWEFSWMTRDWQQLGTGDADTAGRGGMCVIGEEVVLASGHRFDLLTGTWLSTIPRPSNEPGIVLCTDKAMEVYTNSSLYVLNVDAAQPAWQVQSAGGDTHSGLTADGGSLGEDKVFVKTAVGALYEFDKGSKLWTQYAAQNCTNHTPSIESAPAVTVLNQVLVALTADGLWGFHRVGRVPCASSERPVKSLPPSQPLRYVMLRDKGFKGARSLDVLTTGVCFTDRRIFIAIQDAEKPIAIFPETLEHFSGRQLDLKADYVSDHTAIDCRSGSDQVFLLHLLPNVSVSVYHRDGQELTFVRRAVSDLQVDNKIMLKGVSWGLSVVKRDDELYFLILNHKTGSVSVLRDAAGKPVVEGHMQVPVPMVDYTGMDVDETGRVLIVSRAESRAVLTLLSQDGWNFDTSNAVIWEFPREENGAMLHCNIMGVAWVDDSHFLTVASDRQGATDGPECVPWQQSAALWELKSEEGGTKSDVQLDDYANVRSALTVSQPWALLSRGPAALVDHSAVVNGDIMWVFGGESQQGVFRDEMLSFNFTSLRWKRWDVRPRPQGRRRAVLVADEPRSRLLLLGGEGEVGAQVMMLRDMWAFDLNTGEWHELPSYKSGNPYAVGPRQGTSFAAAASGDTLVVVGTTEGSRPNWLSLDLRSDSWRVPFMDSRLAVASPAVSSVSTGVFAAVGGVRNSQGGYKPRHTLLLDTRRDEPAWRWEDAAGSDTTLAGGSWTLLPLGEGLLMFDTRRASGRPNNTVSLRSSGEWEEVSIGGEWLPARSSMSAVAYGGRLFVFGGVSGQVHSDELWVYDPTLCPNNCSGRGVCTAGNCRCEGAVGVSCENVLPGEEPPVVTIVVSVLSAVLVAVLVRLFVSQRKARQYRQLYDDAKVAEDMASQIQDMELEKLSYLDDIQNPTPTQRAFRNIVATLALYKSYLPHSVLVHDTEEDAAEDPEGEEGKAEDRHASRGSGSGPDSTLSSGDCGDSMGVRARRMSRHASKELRTRGRRSRVTLIAGNKVGFLSSGDMATAATERWISGDVEQWCQAVFEAKGVVDLIQGDRRGANFNARQGCASHAVAAVEVLSSRVSGEWTGCAVNGPAVCGDFGCVSATRFMVLGGVPWSLFTLERTAALWRKRVLIDGEAYSSACFSFEGELIGAVFLTKRSTKALRLFNIVKKHNNVAGGAEEWMYTLANMEESEWEKNNAARNALVKEKLESLSPQNVDREDAIQDSYVWNITDVGVTEV